jgi:RNA polymerase sigma-70 factor (ECF subfamily)
VKSYILSNVETIVKTGGGCLQDDAFLTIYQKYYAQVYGYLYGLTSKHQLAEDIAQDVFFKAFCVLNIPDERIKFWLLKVAHNCYRDYMKKNRRIEYLRDEFIDKYSSYENELSKRENISNAFELLNSLPENQRQAVLLCLVNDLSHEHAAEVMNLSVSAVTNLIYRARKTIRELRIIGASLFRVGKSYDIM